MSKTRNKTFTDDDIPSSFRKSEEPICTTVGELLEQLSKLPPDLPIYEWREQGIRVGVSNIHDGTEPDGWLALSLEGESEDDWTDEE